MRVFFRSSELGHGLPTTDQELLQKLGSRLATPNQALEAKNSEILWFEVSNKKI